jgi:hypothetical protein
MNYIRLTLISFNQDFKTLESTRPDFLPSTHLVTKSPNPEWLPGQGSANLNQSLPGVKEGLWSGTGGTYKQIDPTVTPPLSLYKMMISAIVRS